MTNGPAELTPLRQKRQLSIAEVDRHVGQRLRLRRRLLGISQLELGHRIGTSPQQVRKYETGANRLSVSRLDSCARILGVDVTYFFEGLGAAAYGSQLSETQHLLLDLFRHVTMIRDRRYQTAVCTMVRALRRLN